LKKYPVVTGEEFTRKAMERNFAALKAKKEALEKKETLDEAAAVPVGA
jgi:hypothetical protein